MLKCYKKIIVLVEKNVYKLNSPAPNFCSTWQLLARQNNLEFPTAPRGGCCHSRHDTKGEYFLDPKVKVEIEMKRRYTAQLWREESREMILFPPETSPAGEEDWPSLFQLNQDNSHRSRCEQQCVLYNRPGFQKITHSPCEFLYFCTCKL